MSVNYNFLVKVYSELTQDQKIKFNKSIQIGLANISKAVWFNFLAPRAGLEPATNWLTVNCSTNWATEECELATYFFFTLTQEFFLEATPGIEPGYKDLQSSA